MSNLIQEFASTQSQSQLGLASQAFGLNSASKSSPYLSGVTADSKPSCFTTRLEQTCECCAAVLIDFAVDSKRFGKCHEQAQLYFQWSFVWW